MKKAITDIQTGITEILDLTEEEVADIKNRQDKIIEMKEAEATKAAEKAALLERLGITQDEAKLLLS